MKIQTKTTILFTLLTMTVFLVLTVTVYYFSNQFAYNDFYKRLELRARISAKFTFEKDHISTESFKLIQQQYLEKLEDEKSYIIPLSVNGEPQPPFPPRVPVSYLKEIKKANGATAFFQGNLVNYAGLLYKDETGDFLVVESATNKYGAEIMRRLRNILIITLVASALIIYGAGLYFSRRTFQPIRHVTHRVQAISEGNLQLRLHEPEGSDEVAELIKIFNKMLDRLETAFETQNNFVSNASHELRTPLTAIVAEADYALSKERTIDVYRQSLQQILQQADKLQHLTKGLLSLAQTSFDGSKQRWEKVRIDELLFEVKDNTTEILPKSNICVQLPELPVHEDDIMVYGNQDLLKIALGNIIINACKYSNNAPVWIELAFKNRHAAIIISDKGIGIPEKEIPHIYDPFFRASNAKNFEGYGIGMPLSEKIIRLHKGTINVQSKVNEGTVITISLPIGEESLI